MACSSCLPAHALHKRGHVQGSAAKCCSGVKIIFCGTMKIIFLKNACAASVQGHQQGE